MSRQTRKQVGSICYLHIKVNIIPISPKWSPQGNTGNQYVLKSIVELILSRLRQKPREAPGEDERGDRSAYNAGPLGESDWTAQPAAPDSCGRHHRPRPDGL